MTKARRPLSVEDAVMQALGVLGVEEAAALIGVHGRELRHWTDPDSDRRPIPLPWAAALDVACMAAGETPPLYRAYRRLLTAGDRRRGGGEPSAALGLVMIELGDIARALAAAKAAEGPAGSAICADEAAAIMREIDEARAALAELERAVSEKMEQLQ